MEFDPLWKNVSTSTDVLTMRSKVVAYLDSLILKGKTDWNDWDPSGELGSKQQWAKTMLEWGTFADRNFIQLASEYLSREFVIIPVIAPKSGSDRVVIKPFTSTAKYAPFYFLYFSDARFYSPHYQSIRPNTATNQNMSMPPVPPVRRPIGSVPDDICDITSPILTSSGQKTSSESTSVIESSQVSKNKREQSYMSQENVISPSKKRRRVARK